MMQISSHQIIQIFIRLGLATGCLEISIISGDGLFELRSGGQMILLPPGAPDEDHVYLLYGLQLLFILRQDVDR